MYESLRIFLWKAFLKVADGRKVEKCIGARGNLFAVIVLIKFYNLITFATVDNANLPNFGTQQGQSKKQVKYKSNKETLKKFAKVQKDVD